MADTYIIGCIPLWVSPRPPKEQKQCVLQDCPVCRAQMWVSESKRDIMKSGSPLNPKLMCFNCIAKKYPTIDSDTGKVEHLDISEVKWMERKVNATLDK